MATKAERIKDLQRYYPDKKIVDLSEHSGDALGLVTFEDGSTTPNPAPPVS